MGDQVEEELTTRATIRRAGGKLTELVPSWRDQGRVRREGRQGGLESWVCQIVSANTHRWH